MGKISEDNKEIRVKNKQAVRKVERQYVDGVLVNLEEVIQEKRKEIEDKLTRYCEENKVTAYTKDGTSYEKPNTNPILIQKYFFQSINPLVNVEPMYSPEKLGIVWQLYEEMVGKVSSQIGMIIPNLSSFCSFAGIRLSTFKSYKKSLDEDFRIVVEKIEDGCYDSNLTLAQMGYIKERSTVYRMKSEQERVEKEMPDIHIHEGNNINLGDIRSRLDELKGFNEKKRVVEGEIVDGK